MTSFYEELHKSEKFSDEEENILSRATIDKWILRLLLFLIGFMPLIVMANVEEVISPLVSNIDVLSSGTKGDLFTHYKALFVLIITVITGAMLLIKVLFMEGKIRKTYLNYVLGLFVVAIVVSTIASPNISVALNGQYNRSDGAISWLCYVALMFIAMNIAYPKRVVSYIMYTMMPFVFINFYIIMMNFYGKDLLVNNAWMQTFVSLFSPEGANISEGSVLVGTLNQWNYMSGMFAIMTVMYLAWAVSSTKMHEAIIGSITASVSISTMFLAMSTSGFLTVLIAIPFILIFFIRIEKKRLFTLALIIFTVVTIPLFNIFATKDFKIWTESFGFFIDKNPYKAEEISFGDLNKVHASDLNFELPSLPESAFSPGTGRLYIWDKTLDLVQKRAILGYGGDSLIYNFPHYNIDARAGMVTENTIVDKTHNLYIGLLYSYGAFGLIVVLIILAVVALHTIKSSIRNLSSTFILSLTSLAYFIQSMFNDSLPSTSGVVWILIGVLLSIIFNGERESLENGRNY
ncbi:O-antigen ligase family protein [Solibacillus sp. A46]|uniref:O-antigen ligase family protein n=1 Tax=Solibacillus faecavium TaxID=2762221 RepID=A0ABR8Y0S2_9BACL|nr:O-antigen ligase family protein [Solibacillus faecavium]MBD8037766.1 O-antigen ligase family protein [Solibacillus faecavium]